jgi:hypothetical protein
MFKTNPKPSPEQPISSCQYLNNLYHLYPNLVTQVINRNLPLVPYFLSSQTDPMRERACSTMLNDLTTNVMVTFPDAPKPG